jgi:hypothetical protein
VARAKEIPATRQEIGKTSRVWTDDMQCFNAPLRSVPQIDSPDRNTRISIPGVYTVRQHGELPWNAVRGKRIQCSHTHESGLIRFPPEWIEEYGETRSQRDRAEDGSNEEHRSTLEKAAAIAS